MGSSFSGWVEGHRALIAAALFAVVAGVHAVCPVKTAFDSHWSIPVAVSLLREGNIDLDEYALTAAMTPHGVHTQNGHLYNDFPIGASLLELPCLVAFDQFVRLAAPLVANDVRLTAKVHEWERGLWSVGVVDLDFYATVEMVIASLFVGLTTALLFLAFAQAASGRSALIAALTFAFATSAWSTASRAMWQHVPSLLCTSIALWALLRAAHRPTAWPWLSAAGAALTFGYVSRPTNAWAAALLGLYVLVRHRRQVPAFAAGVLLVALPFFAQSLFTYGTLLPLYHQPQRLAVLGNPTFLEALAGNLISPSRGLLTTTPILALAAVGVAIKWRARTLTLLDGVFGAIVALHWLSISAFPHWWAGHSYGPRFFTDVLPYLVYFLLPVLEAIPTLTPTRRALATAGAVLLLSVSAGVHARGATADPPWRWNDGPPNVDEAPGRVWDWRDIQALRR